MKIAIIGAGNIGGTLGRKWLAAGHEVVFGVREPVGEKAGELPAPAYLSAEAAAGADVVLFAIPGKAMADTAAQLAPHLNGKIVIDATNQPGQPTLHSLAILRQAAPEAHLFRAFSTLGWENFANPVLGGHTADLFYCGDAGVGQAAVQTLIEQIGLHPVSLGGLDQVELVDSLTRLWFTLAFQKGYGRRVAFKLLHE